MQLRLFDMVGCLANAVDLVSPEVAGHHRRVGILAQALAEEAGLPAHEQADLALAGLLHDVGAFTLKDRLAALAFESSDQTHPEIGARLLEGSPGLSRAAEIVRCHHLPWRLRGEGRCRGGVEAGNLLGLADRVDTLLPRAKGAPIDRQRLDRMIREGRGRLFNPAWVEAFEALAARPGHLEALAEAGAAGASPHIPEACNPGLRGEDVSRLSRLFSQIIDFRCRFTATHSRGVTATAMALASELGMDGHSRDVLEIAGELHDLGKLGVPAEIIMKPSALDPGEMRVMQSHAENGFNALASAPALADVALLVGQHHERLDGKGYPHGIPASSLGLGARVLTVADMFTAMAEDRPYRAGMELSRIVGILEDMAAHGSLDPDVVGVASARRGMLDETRRRAQKQALAEFECFAGGLALVQCVDTA
ncbi:3'3'-cGAMP-specific phosphodiesterase 1 [Fundidesulfovibrio magnetotacticus]|uniref:3'3'-cGAMP-specific phosphodiesterase 1 n=1 Tax=Fundidesulfovibrio magnetotacticus TaxID=2730080 RepID=A0A6V8LMP6_9BACT|nr:HD domain-containing phosphohydrolase [Fundidesulfovibrio magnetotacticus]GFK93933.1 3'3'-cGAMP-specific phosphodiesterase 1 [Fundidesulfovibrio magnetotacticus]